MIYVTDADLYDNGYFGVRKKIESQTLVFKEYFGRACFTFCSGQMFYLMEDGRVVDKELSVTREQRYAAVSKWLDQYNIQRMYIRYHYSDKWFLQFLKSQKEKGIKTLLEIPTYPYDGEIAGERCKRLRIEDAYYRGQLHQYIDRVAANSEAGEIWGMPCIKFLNGVDVESCPFHPKSRNEKKIVLIGVSTMAPWHGYERILEGLVAYYNNRGEYDIRFKIVGNGSEKNRYQLLTQSYGLQSKVEFCGMLEGQELDEQYALSDLAVSSLGLYKTGIEKVTPIKGAEYCARGLPFICGYQDLRFPDSADYILTVPNDSSPVNMQDVVHFYETVTSQKGYQEKMREYALENFTWKSMMEPVTGYLR